MIVSDKHSELKEHLSTYGPVGLIVLVAFLIAYQFVKPAPPDRVLIATGQEEGAYKAFADRYGSILTREGIELVVRTTAGSVENLQLLESGEVDVGFVQGGVPGELEDTQLSSLGSLYFEPLWLFHRSQTALSRLNELTGLRIAVGSQGSGTRALVTRLLMDNGVDGRNAVLLEIGGAKAAAALEEGEVDVAFFVTSATNRLIKRLLHAPEIALASLQRAEAYARRYRFLSTLVLPEGSMDLAENIPAQPVKLLASAANLVAGPELHPAIVDLLLQAAEEVHGPGSWFEASGQFPTTEYLDFTLNRQANRFYKYGPPFLQRFMPFWAASLVDRLKIMLLPLVVLLIPVVKIMPPVYAWRMRSRIYRWYRELNRVDLAISQESENTRHDELLARLDRIEHELQGVKVPLSFASQLYHLRQHIDLVRNKLL